MPNFEHKAIVIKMKLSVRLIFILVSVLLPKVFAEGLEKADGIVKRADQARAPQEDFSMSVQVTDAKDGEVKKSTYRVGSKDTTLSLVEQTEPVRLQGRKLLMRDHDLWLFTPNIKRPTRISFEQKLTGEVANGDLMRTNFANDYAATLSGEESIGGLSTMKLHLIARNKEVTYRSIDYWVEKTKFYPVQAVFYALSGKPLKTAKYSAFKLVLGKQRMTQVMITDSLQPGRTSQMNYLNFKREKFDDSYFSKESLGQ